MVGYRWKGGLGRRNGQYLAWWALGITLLSVLSYSVPANALPLGATSFSSQVTVTSGASSQTLTTPVGRVALVSALTGSGLGGHEVGPVGPSTSAQIVVTMSVNNPAMLALFDQQVSDPSSPLYAHFLTLQQFTEAFSPPASETSAVASWLSSSGLQVRYVSSDHLTIEATGTTSELSKAFGVSFATYRDAVHGSYWAPSGTPTLPAQLAPWILGVEGLNNLPSSVHTNFVQNSKMGPMASPGSGVLDYPTYMHQIFQLDQMYNSTGNASHGVVASYAQGVKIAQTLWASSKSDCGYSLTDMNEFFNLSDGYWSGLPKPTIQPHYSVPGYTTSAPGTGTCGDIELTLDMQYSGTDAPGAYLDPTWVSSSSNAALEALLSWLLTNVPNLDVITQSWGGNDVNMTAGSFEATYEQDYQQATSMGISLFASSADGDGSIASHGTCTNPGTPGLDFPGSSPYVMSVGGSANMVAASTTYSDNYGNDVWNWCQSSTTFAGSQGGVSTAFPKAWYQIGYAVNSSMGNAITTTTADGGAPWSTTSARPAPDWSGPGANMASWHSGAWLTGYGGTSFSSPATAGLTGAMMVYLGHKLGQLDPAFYGLMFQYLYKQPNNLLDPVYFVNNGSNAYFNGAQDYNTSTGYGIPMALNLSKDLGKPFVATNPEGGATVGAGYPITATVNDIQSVNYVNVSYLAPGGTWQNTTLTLSSGSSTSGTWTGSIPAASLTTTGTLQYCVWATDRNQGNSWSPYNLSAWATTGNLSKTFGCATPFNVDVIASAGSITVNPIVANRTATGETNYALCFNTSFTATKVTAPFYLNWTWGDGTKTSASTSATSVTGCHIYTTPTSSSMTLFVNSSKNTVSGKASLTIAVYQHVQAAFTVSSTHPVVPANETFANTSLYGHGAFTLAWNFGNGNTSTAVTPPNQIYYKPGTYTIALTVTDALGYTSTASYSLTVWGSASAQLSLVKGWNLVALPLIANAYTAYELSVLMGAPFSYLQVLVGTGETNYSRPGNSLNGSVAISPGNGIWINVSSAISITIWGNASSTVSGVAFGPGWSGIGWSSTSAENASTLAASIPGAQAICWWDSATQTWVTYIVGFSDPTYNFNIPTGSAVYVWTTASGTFTE